MAIVSCVKLLAVPGPPPGPCDASAAWAESKTVAADAKESAVRHDRRHFPDEGMKISCNGSSQKIRITVWAGFDVL
jgi:hypothetical protein